MKSNVMARIVFESETERLRKLKFTYTDRVAIDCYGATMFEGPSHEQFHPDKATHGFSRLIFDQYEVEVPVKTGTNTLIVRSQMKEPLFAWGFGCNGRYDASIVIRIQN